MEFLYIDGEKICVYKDGKVSEYESGYVKRYRETSLSTAKNNEWKRKGRTERLLNEDYFFHEEEGVYVLLHSIAPTGEDGKILYSFTVNDSSGIYCKYLGDEKKTEAHVVSSNEVDFTTLTNTTLGLLATVKKGDVTADIALFSEDKSEYKCLTGGDSLDENPSFRKDGKILFNSYGVGRDENNNFLEYAPSEIYLLDLDGMEITEMMSDPEYSFVKPIENEDGFYCIQKPAKEKEKRNPLLEILLIPVRIVQGIVGFVSFFVTMFSGKQLVKDNRRGSSMARNFKKDERKIFVLNNFVRVENELKKNSNEKFYGFIPRSWKLIEVKKDKATGEVITRELVRGVADYCVLEDGTILYTNGKHVFSVKKTDEKNYEVDRLVGADCCLKVAPAKPTNIEKKEELFSNL